jgi:hypothetical protein
MHFPDKVKKCSAFVQHQTATGRHHLDGTAFFVSVSDTMEGRAKKYEVVGFPYLVTARHVLQEIWNTYRAVVQIRVNLVNGSARIVETVKNQWLFPETNQADIAVLPWTLPDDDLDIWPFPLSEHYTVEGMKKQGLGVSDTIHSIGLFTVKPGLSHNIPIVRTGTIAAMPEELVNTVIGDFEAYIVELRSIRGLSGSPVFIPTVQGHPNSALRLMGVLHGHWNVEKREDLDLYGHSKLHVGVGVVTPIERVLEVVWSPMLMAARAEAAKQVRAAGKVTPDCHE